MTLGRNIWIALGAFALLLLVAALTGCLADGGTDRATSTSADEQPIAWSLPGDGLTIDAGQSVTINGEVSTTATPEPEATVVHLDAGVLFDHDSDELRPERRAELVALLRTLLAEGASAGGVERPALRVTGHTDARGTAEHNLGLSRRRAEAVAQLLDELGVDTKTLDVRGVGEDEMLADWSPLDPRQRRVTISWPGAAPTATMTAVGP